MKFPAHRALLLAALLFAAGPDLFADAPSRLTLPLDTGWQFALVAGTNISAPAPTTANDWETVSLPHTWNAFDGQDGGANYHRGTGWYQRRLTLPPAAAGRRVIVEFDAASRSANVFVNGHTVGSHIGAFARFRFDITDALKLNGDNILAVRVNNATNDFIPRGGDFTQYGGLYRSARLLLTAPAHIATLDSGSSGVYFTTKSVSVARAEVAARVKLANDSDKVFAGEVRVRVLTADGAAVKSFSTKVHLAARATDEVTLLLSLNNPHLWNGVADPYVYRAIVELVSNGKVIDAVEQPLGLRSFEVTADRGFILNGRPVPLRGVSRHQDRQDKGWAISEADQRQDLAIIRELGANTVRLAHYQHDQFFYDLCDASGLAVWAELAFVVDPPTTESGRANAQDQLRELIRQNYNHPSIFFWSIGNESRGTNESHALLTQLAAVARAEDPARPCVYASNHKLDDIRNFVTDLLALNRYFGWYAGDYADFGPFVDQFHADNPKIPLGVSEYGAGASIYQHEVNPPIRIPQALNKGHWHPEEWQTRYHEETWLQIKARQWLWATYIWNMFDFSADERAEGDQFGRNDKGLVTYDRQIRKDAFYWYQANWTTNAMVHIVSKFFSHRLEPKTDLRVYSNCEEVEVRLNGVSLGRTNSADCRFIWPDVTLQPGPNRLEAYAYRAGKPSASDFGSWTLRADGDPLPNKYVVDAEAEAERRKAERAAERAAKAAQEKSEPTAPTPAPNSESPGVNVFHP